MKLDYPQKAKISNLNWLQALSGIRIVEKIERIGLESILASTAQTTSPTFMNSIYTQRPANTQLAQLSTIKGSISSTSTSSSDYSDSSSSSDLLKEKPPLHGSSTSSNKVSSIIEICHIFIIKK